MYEIRTETDIESTPDRLWSILTDFPAQPSWTLFIRSIEGPAEALKNRAENALSL
jgi:hypothetical protein